MATYKDQNTALDIAISRLEIEKKEKYEDLKWQLEVTANSLKPINIIKDTVQDFQQSPDLKSSFVKGIASLTGGYLSKKLLFGKSKSTIKNILGYVLQYGMTHLISKKVNSNS